MAAILQTIVWQQYFIHIAHKFGNWFGNVLCQMETTKNCPQYVSTFRPRQCDRHFTDNVFKLIQIASNCIQNPKHLKINLEAHFAKKRAPSFGHDVLTLSGRDSEAVILLMFSNWFPFIKLLYFLSQFSLKHSGYFASDTITGHK